MKRFARSVRAARAQQASRPGRNGAVELENAVQSLSIEEMGARGHGVARGDRGPIYVPLSLPGETIEGVVTGDRGECTRILQPSPERVAAECPVFGSCGGCQLQHWAQPPYLAWKESTISRAMAKRGLAAPIAPIVPAWGAGRRRAAFHAARRGRAIDFGFMRRNGTGIEPITACPLLSASLQAKMPALERLAAALVPDKGEIVLQCLETLEGLDVNVRGAGRGPAQGTAQDANLSKTTAAALGADIARLSFEGEVFLAQSRPRLRIGLADVAPPPGAFVQATQAGEDCIADLVIEAMAGASRFADLFCGLGTFALRLAAHGEVLAVEGDEPMLLALRGAADGAAGRLKAITTLRRDLLRNPLSALEMKRVDGVVLDPPRSGARLQAEQIAASKVSRVASVSCDAITFARDAQVLIDGGFRLTRLTPIDQFRWSPHIELVGAFER